MNNIVLVITFLKGQGWYLSDGFHWADIEVTAFIGFGINTLENKLSTPRNERMEVKKGSPLLFFVVFIWVRNSLPYIGWWRLRGGFLWVWWLGKSQGKNDQPSFSIVSHPTFLYSAHYLPRRSPFTSEILVLIFISLIQTWKLTWVSVLMDY